jgi:hypothetical protein
MANFETRLRQHYSAADLRERFDLKEFDRDDVARRLTAMQSVVPMKDSAHLKTTPDALLFQEFIRCQEETNFASRQYLMESLHRYAKEQNKEVLFCTNAADLGIQNPGGHWIRALMFADLTDLFAYELNNDPEGRFGAPQARVPRGKWAAFHKLAYAVHHRRSAALIHSQDVTALINQAQEGSTFLAWMGAQAIEAYAAGGAYIPFHVEIGQFGRVPMRNIWSRVFEHNRFVQQHQDLYQGDLACGSSVAFLFLFNERGRTIPAVYPSYLGLAQGFVEGSYPFDVVFAGDGRYVQDRLDAEQLAPYRAIVVPSPIQPTENQKQIVQQFARAGGVVVCQEPELLGLSAESVRESDDPGSWWEREFTFGDGRVRVLAGEITPTDTGDVGANFYRQYTPELRAEVAQLADDLGLAPLLPDHREGLLSAFPVVQPDRRRAVVHLVNYDVDYEADAIRPKSAVRLQLPAPSFLPGELKGTLYHCRGDRTEDVPLSRDESLIRCTIPRVDEGAVLVIETADAR